MSHINLVSQRSSSKREKPPEQVTYNQCLLGVLHPWKTVRCRLHCFSTIQTQILRKTKWFLECTKFMSQTDHLIPTLMVCQMRLISAQTQKQHISRMLCHQGVFWIQIKTVTAMQAMLFLAMLHSGPTKILTGTVTTPPAPPQTHAPLNSAPQRSTGSVA